MSAEKWMREPNRPYAHRVNGNCVVLKCRPVVVIDPEDREQVERLHGLWCQAIVSRGTSSRQIDSMQAALREFANPTPPPPKLAEPQGLGAVVEDDDGVRWTRVEAGDAQAPIPWYPADCDKWPRDYADLNVVRVLSEGVTP